MTTMILSGALGFLLASLIALFLAPPLWRRAVRVTTKRLIQQSPRMIDEGHADRDQMRAEFAVTTRKMEVKIERLKETSDTQLIELSKAEKKRDRLQGKLESLQTTLQKRDVKIEKLGSKVERLLADIGKKSEQLTTQSERLVRQTEIINAQAATVEQNGAELDELKKKIAEYARKEIEFSTITSKQDLELTSLRTMQQQHKKSQKSENAARKQETEQLRQEVSDGLKEIANLTKNLEARKIATIQLRQEVGKNKEKISELIREIRDKDKIIWRLNQKIEGAGPTEEAQTKLASKPSEIESVPSSSVEGNHQDNDNKASAANLPKIPATPLNALSGQTRGDTPSTNGVDASKNHRTTPSTKPSGANLKAIEASEKQSLAERIRALQTDHPKSM